MRPCTCLLVVSLLAVGGCGGAKAPAAVTASAPAPVATTTKPQNYLGDLTRRFYWAQSVIRFRFTRPSDATDIGGASIPAVALSESEKAAARSAFAQWQEALSTCPEMARRTFVEVGETEPADIEIIVIPKVYFGTGVLGYSNSFWRTTTLHPTLTRSVVSLREGTPDSDFAFVVLHELGHALMSTDHAKRSGCVMYACVPQPAPKAVLTEADGNTIRENYESYSQPH